MAANLNDKIFVVNETTNTAYGGVDPTGQFQTIGELRGYKSYVALLKQKGDGTTETQSSGLLNVGRTYEITYNSPGMDFTNVGAPNNEVGTFFVSTGGSPKSWGIDEGDEDILQTTQGAPLARVLENTIGNIWFTYDGAGFYSAQSNGLFNINKTTALLSPNGYVESPADIYNIDVAWSNNSTNAISISSYYNNNPTDDAFNYSGDAMIEIRVYN